MFSDLFTLKLLKIFWIERSKHVITDSNRLMPKGPDQERNLNQWNSHYLRSLLTQIWRHNYNVYNIERPHGTFHKTIMT
jgi:hypothetical protein